MASFIIGLIVLMFVLDLGFSLLNYSQRKKPLPDNVEGIYDEASYTKWLQYTMEKMRMELIGKTISVILMVGLLISGFFGILETFSQSFSSNTILQTLIFLACFMGIELLVSLPFEWIDTFKIEAKYGFNKTSVKIFWMDQFKSLILGALLMAILVSVMMALYQAFIDTLPLFILGLWLFIALLMIVIYVLNTKVFVRLFNKLTPIEEGDLKDKIQALAKRSGFEVKAISVMDASKRSTKLNAFFSGLGKTREVVLYDTLIAKMTHEQILAVLAHELGHAKHRDTVRMLMIQILVFGLYALGIGFVLKSPVLFTSFGLSEVSFGFAVILFSILMEPLGLLIGIPVNALSRQAETKADAYAVSMTDKKDMAEVLRILVTENFSNLNPHPYYVLLHYSHPPIAQRLKALDR